MCFNINNEWKISFSLSAFDFVTVQNFSYSNKYVMVSRYNFYLNFQNNTLCVESSNMLTLYFYILFGEYLLMFYAYV